MVFEKKGFTLVEIMIVVAIIVMLAALAIPNLLRARLNANEATAIGAMKTLSTAAQTYFIQQTPSAFPPSISAMSASDPPYIDSVLGSGNKSGYSFTWTGGGNVYEIVGAPVAPNVTGTRTFFVDQSGIVRVGADSTGTPIS
jgi:prepilin-type N-terminal cleavage/methylation domain-containing protein